VKLKSQREAGMFNTAKLLAKEIALKVETLQRDSDSLNENASHPMLHISHVAIKWFKTTWSFAY